MEMEHAHPMEISSCGFYASHLLQLATKRFFRQNDKHPVSPTESIRDTRDKLRDRLVVLFCGLTFHVFVCEKKK